jgi:hypothetical protein
MGIGTGFEEEGAANHLCVLQKVGVCVLFKTARRFTSARYANQTSTQGIQKNKQNRPFARIQIAQNAIDFIAQPAAATMVCV